MSPSAPSGLSLLRKSVEPRPSPAEIDLDLLSRVQRGEEPALDALYERHAALVYSVALRILHDAAKAENVLQETLLELWFHPQDFQPEQGDLTACLAAVARRRAVTLLRRRELLEPSKGLALALGSPGIANRTSLRELARPAVVQLPPHHRKLLEMAIFDGLDPSDIAEVAGAPSSLIQAHLRAALASLGRALES